MDPQGASDSAAAPGAGTENTCIHTVPAAVAAVAAVAAAAAAEHTVGKPVAEGVEGAEEEGEGELLEFVDLEPVVLAGSTPPSGAIEPIAELGWPGAAVEGELGLQLAGGRLRG